MFVNRYKWRMLIYLPWRFDTSEGYIYSTAAAFLDLEDPTNVISRLPYLLIFLKLDYEKNGILYTVVFYTGTALFDDKLYIYYGATDNCIEILFFSVSTFSLLFVLVFYDGSTQLLLTYVQQYLVSQALDPL